ncbi:hypothetical protein [Streptomyces lavendulae]|uniref:hypothetical protein n=1 Tax=Streptomyces lavendulae TaxID=1914 RepID=UPI0024A27932|nr:hypothetical protein [Streptomyces lavendulae]GLX21761.1 hypothetical protein Slala01_54050 [Streptomyces lavendulae subsp. lavendulae]GLX28394.1 hypothetical protein Slala02_42140 [Streptomyces lavendulae subsp. lavendulae]
MRTGPRAALALVLCCTALAGLAGCGQDRDGYAVVGAAAAGPERSAGENVPPRGQVEFQPLASGGPAPSADAPGPTPPGAPGSRPADGFGPGGGTATAPVGSAPAPGTPPDPGTPATPGGTGGAGTGATTPGAPGTPAPPAPPTSPGAPGTPAPPAPPAPKPGTTPPVPPATPARLTLGTPVRAAASSRWCERVTVTFTNTGTTAARSGTVSFATHVIGALGVDWATITPSQPLPAPIAGGGSKTQTYTVCVEAWRVPLGMHVETRNVSAAWN